LAFDFFIISENYNKSYPYLASLCRSHGLLLSGVLTLGILFPFRRLGMKSLIITGGTLFGLSTAATKVVTYKWDYPKN